MLIISCETGAWVQCVAMCVCVCSSFSSLQEPIFPSCTAVITAHFLAVTHHGCLLLQRAVKVSAEPHTNLLTSQYWPGCLSSCHVLCSDFSDSRDLEVQSLQADNMQHRSFLVKAQPYQTGIKLTAFAANSTCSIGWNSTDRVQLVPTCGTHHKN